MKITVCEKEIELDPGNLIFNETTLSKYLEEESSWVDFFGRAMINAEREYLASKEISEVTYYQAFVAYKDEGATEKKAEAQARIEVGVIAAREAEIRMKLIKQHLRSWDNSHEDAINFGYNLRKEMDKIQPRIMGSGDMRDDFDSQLERVIRSETHTGET